MTIFLIAIESFLLSCANNVVFIDQERGRVCYYKLASSVGYDVFPEYQPVITMSSRGGQIHNMLLFHPQLV